MGTGAFNQHTTAGTGRPLGIRGVLAVYATGELHKVGTYVMGHRGDVFIESKYNHFKREKENEKTLKRAASLLRCSLYLFA